MIGQGWCHPQSRASTQTHAEESEESKEPPGTGDEEQQSVVTLYSPSIHPPFTLYSPSIHPLFTLYSPSIHPLLMHHSVEE